MRYRLRAAETIGRVAGLLPVLLTFLPQFVPAQTAAAELEVDWRGFQKGHFDVSSWDEKSDMDSAKGRRLLTGVTLNWNTSVHNLAPADLAGDVAIKASFESAFKTVVADVAGSYINVGDIAMTIDAFGIETTITMPDNASSVVNASLTADVTTYVQRLNTAMQGVTNIGTVSTGTVSIASMTALVLLRSCHASCAAPQYVTNGRDNELCKEGMMIGNINRCTTQCKIGYSPSVGSLLCSQGQLLPDLFTCSPSACEVPVGPNTKWPPCTQGSTLQHGSPCTPNCPSGYSARVGITCQFGNMSATVACDPLPCSPPNGASIKDSLPNVCAEGNSIQHGNICTAQCKTPAMASPDVLVCMEGNIVPSTFKCEELQSVSCSAPASVTGANSPSCTQGTSINSGYTCTPSCQSGRKASVASLQCDNGVLTPPTFQCRQSCTAPTGVTGLKSPSCAEGPTIESGQQCTVMCSGSLVGSPGQMMCSDGALAGVGSLVCQAPSGPPCPPPSGIVNMAPQACAENPINGGGLCTGQCLTGYVASPKALLCTGGSLSPSSFLCMNAPCNVVQPVSAATPPCERGVVDGKIQSGLTCEAKCLPGYVPFPNEIICRQGELTPPTFTCRDWTQMGADFGPQTTDIFCTVGVTCQLVGLKGKGLQAGDYLMLLSKCGAQGVTLQNQGYSATAMTSSQCGTKFFFGSLPVGEAQMCWCPKAINCGSDPKNFRKLIGTLRVRCPPGTYNNNGRCKSSACTAPDSSSIANANASLPACSQGNTILSGGYCTTQCAAPYKPTVTILNCRNSKLLPSTYGCRAPATFPCPAPQLITYAAPIACKQGNDIPHQLNCTTQCAKGYTALPSILFCDDGVLTPPRFICQESECSVPTVAFAAAESCVGINGTSMRSGASCITQCIPGYVPFPAMTQCFRGEMPSFVCLEWANETEIADAGFGPQGEINLECPLNAPCTLNDLSGAGLQDDDKVMVMTECGAGGKPLYRSGFPETPLKSMKCGATVPMGALSIETTRVGHAELCYCPKALDCYMDVQVLVSGPSPAPPVVGVVANNVSGNSGGRLLSDSGDSTTTYESSQLGVPTTTYESSQLGVPTTTDESQFNHSNLTTSGAGQLGNQSNDTGAPQATRIAGSFTMVVDNVTGFVNDPQAKAGVAKGISTVANVTENMVSVNLRVLRRLKAYSERLLSAGNGSVGVDYVITVPANAPANMASDASSAMTSVSPSVLTAAVTDGMNAVGATTYSVSVAGITPPTVTVGTPPANPPQYITVRRFDPSKFWKRVGRVNTTCPLEGNGRLGYYVNNSYCIPCRPDSGLECGICAVTKVKFQKNGENICSCNPGFFANASDRCEKCGMGSYCPGGNLTQERFECKLGATTLSETSQAAGDCKCGKGRFPEINMTTNITTCEACNEGYYKAGIEDAPCREQCMPNADSAKGAARRHDCFCVPQFYYVPRKETCDLCPGEGITCEGGFTDDIPGQHRAPSADPGYFMTVYDKAAQCQIMVNGTASVCKGGTYADSDDSCEEGATGLICGACADGWTRNEPIMLCGPCEDMPARYIMILGINAELIQRGVFGLFMAQRAMSAALEQKQLDAVILRVWMQWLAIGALLSQFDFSQVELYSWSQESKEMQAAAAVMAAEEEDDEGGDDDEEGEDNSLVEMPEIEMKFEWPNWFQGVMSKVTFLSSVMQASMVGSTQERLECMIDEEYGKPMKYIVTTAFWACYPVLVIIYLVILALLMAKCAYPVYALYFTKFMVMALRKAGGYTHDEALERLAELSEEKIQMFISDPIGILTSPGKMLDLLGREMCLEILAWQIFCAAATRFTSRDMVYKCLERTTIGVELMREFLQDPAAAAENLAETMQEILDEMEEGAEEAAEDAGDAMEDLGEEVPMFEEDALDRLDDLDEVAPTFAVFGFFKTNGLGDICSGIVPVVLITVYSNWDFVTKRLLMAVQTQAFIVEGADGLPETQMRWMGDTRLMGNTGDHFLVAMIAYAGMAMWSFGFLIFLALIINRSSGKLQDVNTLRSYGYFYNGYTGTYWWWELGVKRIDVLLVYLCTYVSIFSDVKAKLVLYNAIAAVLWAVHSAASPYDQRSNSLVDRIEGLGLRVRFFTLLLVQVLLLLDGSSTLCLVVAGFVILINGIFVIIIVVTFIQETGKFGTPAEEGIDPEEDGGNGEAKLDSATSRIRGGGGGDSGGNPIKMVGKFLLGLFIKYVGRYILKFVMKYAMIPFHLIADVKAKLDEEVPHLAWFGVGLPIQVLEYHPGIALRKVRARKYLTMNEDGTLEPKSRMKNKDTTFELSQGAEGDEEGIGKLTGPYGCVIVEVSTNDDGVQMVHHDGVEYRITDAGVWWHPKMLLRAWVRSHYKLSRRHQRNYIARGISETLNYLLVQGNVHVIPHNINDFVCLMPIAIRRITEAGGTIDLSRASCRREILDEIRSLVKTKNESKGGKRTSVGTLSHSLSQSETFVHKRHCEISEFMVTPEEIMGMIVMLQRMTEDPLHDLLVASMDIIKRAQDNVDEERAKKMSLKWAPNNMMPHQGDAGDDHHM